MDVIQSTSDEGKGVVAHVQRDLGAHHSPDLFHVQQELSRATSIALAGQIKQAEEKLGKATAEVEVQRAEKQCWEKRTHRPGRPPNFKGRIAKARKNKKKARKVLDAACKRQERAKQAIIGIGEAYHPFDLRTGDLRTTEQVTMELERHFTDITDVSKKAGLSERCDKGIAKAHRVVPEMTSTISFFHHEVEAQIASLDLSPEQAKAVRCGLVSAAYIERAARKAKLADDRGAMFELALKLRSDTESHLADLAPDKRAAVDRVAKGCADLFQRSSSCVEGRNGRLSLLHHSMHRLRANRLKALTAVNNYFIQRPDGTTAAERFFGAKPTDMFEWLLDHLDMPSRPASKRSSHSATTVLN